MEESGPTAPQKTELPESQAKPTPTPPRGGRPRDVLVALVVLVLIASVFAVWFRARSRATAETLLLYRASVELSDCVAGARGNSSGLRDELELAPPDATPLAPCAPIGERAARSSRELAHIGWSRDRDGLRELEAVVALLPDSLWRERADALAGGELEAVESNVTALVKAACRLALGEGALPAESCPPRQAATPPAAAPVARIVFDSPLEFVEHARVVVAAHEPGDVRVLVATRERDRETLGVALAISNDRAESWRAVFGDAGAADGVPELPRMTVGGPDAPTTVFVSRRDEQGGVRGRLLVLEPGGTRLTAVAELPELAKDLEPVRVGSAGYLDSSKKPDRVVFALVPRDPSAPGGSLLRLGDKGKLDAFATPPGTLLAVEAAPRPRVVVRETSPRPALALYDVPNDLDDRKATWRSAARVFLSGPLAAGALAAEPTMESSCGVSAERLFPFVTRQGAAGSFIAVGAERLYAYPFAPPLDAEPSLLCGSCPPALLLRAEDRLALVLPVGNDMASLPFAAPLALTSAHAGKVSVASCAGDSYAVAYVARDRLYAQVARAGNWQAGRPTLLALPNEKGSITDVRMAALGSRLLVFFRRSERLRLRVEVLASDDGGGTWH
ncbi:MAG: hypothetical protein U0263_39510 [Polyangiaceae bacterium]